MASHQLTTAAADNTASKISKPTVKSCVNALFKYKSAQSSATEKLQLLPQDDYIYLNLTLTKIPSNPRTNPFKIPLTHPVLEPTSEICLIVDDRPKSPTPPSDLIKKLIKSQNIPVSKVIRISKLKTDYKPFEAKRKLCDSYDLFLVDKRVVHLLPKLIGKEFFKKKKLPLGVDLGKKNLKMQVERALGSTLLYLRSGTCCVMKVGKVAMEKSEVVENVFDAIKGAVERVPRKWDGVRSLHLKFCDSIALPVYQAMPEVKLLKIEEMEKGGEEMVAAKVSDGDEGEVKKISGTKDGKKKKTKGRIHEVRYMDVGDDDVKESEDKDGEVVGKLEEIDDDVDDEGVKEIEDEDVSVKKTVGKKRNKVRDEGVKKKAKSEKSEKKAKSEKNEELVSMKKKAKSQKNEELVAAEEKAKSEKNEELVAVKKKKAKSEKSEKKAKSEKSKELADGKKKGKSEKSEELASGKKGKKKRELVEKPSEKIAEVKDAKRKKRVSAK